ncbi:WD40-repeat-containing domain protein [Lentinula raphanica]|nr:WD40-repeat-containing domain protein [Lentinula raphanica]
MQTSIPPDVPPSNSPSPEPTVTIKSDTGSDNVLVPRRRCGIVLPVSNYILDGRRPPEVLFTPKHYSLPCSPGPITKVLQHERRTFVAGSVAGGEVDDLDELPVEHNGPGALTFCFEKDFVNVYGHYRGSPIPKFYSVNDIALYYPRIHSLPYLISSGNDYRVYVWHFEDRLKYEPRLSPPADVYSHSTGVQPTKIAVKTNGFCFAVSSRQVILNIETPELTWFTKPLRLVHEATPARAGPITWGSNSSDSILFASSTGFYNPTYVGHHKAFDVDNEAESFTFALDEDGEQIATNDDGDKLAIFSHLYPQNHIGGSSPQRLLRLYDIRRKDGRSPSSKVSLGHARTNCASFSRDGFYLAIGNANRHVIVHDVRMNRTLRDYVHVGTGRGITHLEWRITRGYRLSLFTAGPDGSVRRWQPEGALDQGLVVANVGTHIAHFAMQNGPSEHDLVIAQSDGTVSFWDGYGEI